MSSPCEAEQVSFRLLDRPSDAPALALLDAECFPADLCWDVPHWRRRIAAFQNVGVFGCFLAHRLIGYTHVGIVSPSETLLKCVVVAKDCRRGKLATKMIEKLREAETALRRPSEWGGTCRESNLPAQLFLKSIGWRCTAILHKHFPDGENGYHFRSGTLVEEM